MSDPKAPEGEAPPTVGDVHRPAAADREGAVALRAEEEEEELDELDDEGSLIAAARALEEEEPDIDLEKLLEETEMSPEAWIPVDDAEQPDVPILEVAAEAPEQRWARIQDLEEPDVSVTDDPGDAPEDPWGPVGAIPRDPPVPPSLPIPPVVPRRAPAPAADAPVVQRVLPWRSLVVPLSPEIGRTLLTTAPTRARSSLLVSSWSWLEAGEPGAPMLVFRLTDDAAAITVRSEAADRPIVACRLAVGGVALEAALDVETARDGVGIVLGRDALAGRFLVDPGAEALDEGPTP